MVPSGRNPGHYELVDVRTFLAVVNCGSMSRAAQRLQIPKSVVSQRVSRLEKALGAELLRRNPRGVTLTERGALYQAQATEGLALLESAAESAVTDRHRVCGTLRLSLPMTFTTHFLGGVLLEFLQLHSEVEFQVELHDHRVDLEAEGYDVGVRIAQSETQSAYGEVRLAKSRRALCCSPRYAATRGVPTRLEDLASHHVIGYSNQDLGRLWQWPASSGFDGTVPALARFSSNNGELMRDAAVAGLGLVVLPLFIVADDLRAGRLIRLLPGYEPRCDDILALCPRRRSRLLRVQLLIEHLRKAFSDVPPWERDLPPFFH